MKNIVWENDHISVVPSGKYKKCTGTRFAAILGKSPWCTPFEAWCDITNTYKKPFEETKYTRAGKIIEPKQAMYIMDNYHIDLIWPAEKYGKDYFKTTHGDFFPREEIFGGMWDYISREIDAKHLAPNIVFEMKTTKRAEDWLHDVPKYYALQAALYARLLGTRTVAMVVSFLEDSDYENPYDFEPNLLNTKVEVFNIYEKFPELDDYLQYVIDWWKKHVLTGVSPKYDTKRDAEILSALRTDNAEVNKDIKELVKDAEMLKDKIDALQLPLVELTKQYKDCTDAIKKYAIDNMSDDENKSIIKGENFIFTVSKSITEGVDKDKMKEDGLYEKYVCEKPAYKITLKKVK